MGENMSWRILAALVALWISSAPVLAVTPDELVDLRRAGLGDEVLLALIETTGVQGPLGAAAALDLKRAGLSDRVIAAAIRRGRLPEAAAATPPDVVADDVPNVAIIGGVEPEGPPASPEVLVVPWIIPVQQAHRPRRPQKPYLGDYRGFARFINDDFRPRSDGFIDPPSRPRDPASRPPRR
jgi:hypothetical protein